jgi:dihydrofolate synthase/folylpolyglutamate synthase
MDHVDWLGNTLEAIGREKAGIFRAGRPAVLGTADVPRSVWSAIEEVGALAVVPDRDYRHRASRAGEANWDFEYGALSLRNLPPPALAGIHQVTNAATALAAIVAAGGIELTHEKVSQGLRSVRLRGRFERVPGEVEWIFDVAHNVPAALGLVANLRTLPRARTIAVCGILGDKDVPGITAALSADIDAWVLVTLEGPRAVPTHDIAALLPREARILAHAPDVVAGCRAARDAAKPGDRILVFGSFLTVGPALEHIAPNSLGL